MINVKDQVYAALCEATENVSDLYPTDWASLPAVQYTEEANNVFTKTDQREQMAQLRYRIDIWNTASTSAIALAIDEKMSALGLTRIECADIADGTGMRHKQMRYEGVIDESTETVYWYGSR